MSNLFVKRLWRSHIHLCLCFPFYVSINIERGQSAIRRSLGLRIIKFSHLFSVALSASVFLFNSLELSTYFSVEK